MTAAQALALAAGRLRGTGVDDPARDARRLLAHALEIEPGRVTLILPDDLPAAAEARFEALIDRRVRREPVAKITGQREFYGRRFEVTPNVLDPRPETELLVDIALGEPFARVLDLGTGSGCVLLSLLAERPDARGCGTDISEAALAVAVRNRQQLGLEGRCDLQHGSWFETVEGAFDLILSNPPYIARDEMAGLEPEVRLWDPEIALTDDGDGLQAYRAILKDVGVHLAPGGRLLVEIGHRQGPEIMALFHDSGLSDIRLHQDLNGLDRVISGVSALK